MPLDSTVTRIAVLCDYNRGCHSGAAALRMLPGRACKDAAEPFRKMGLGRTSWAAQILRCHQVNGVKVNGDRTDIIVVQVDKLLWPSLHPRLLAQEVSARPVTFSFLPVRPLLKYLCGRAQHT